MSSASQAMKLWSAGRGVGGRGFTALLVTCGLLCAAPAARAFALLGPFAPWMTTNIGYRLPNQAPEEIGGPMDLGEEYRWNIPVVTYGFDPGFLDYFGQAGVDAVEQAIQVINDLPPASEMVVTNYSLHAKRNNFTANAASLLDLKLATLQSLLERMGLASPQRYVWAIREWYPSSCLPCITTGIVLRNFDPFTQQPSTYVNAVWFDFFVYARTSDYSLVELITSTADPFLGYSSSAVADGSYSGDFYTGLTQDDAGGLHYLFSRTNINVESLDDSVTAVGDANHFVRTAPRPGIEKLSFMRHPTDSAGQFIAATNLFADVYFTNGLAVTQRVQRVVTRPDFLFVGKEQPLGLSPYDPYFTDEPMVLRTGTTNWVNHSALNGHPGGDGPGVIRPPVHITFNTPGRYIAAAGGAMTGQWFNFSNWASFDGTTNAPVVFMGPHTNDTSITLGASVVSTNGARMFAWTLFGRVGGVYRIDASADLVNWEPKVTITNAASPFPFTTPATDPRQFYRAVLEN